VVLHERSLIGLVRIVDEIIDDEVLPFRMAQLPHALHKCAKDTTRVPYRLRMKEGYAPGLAQSALRCRAEQSYLRRAK
jgi:hypothetical protein